jgi:hypothetical protein
MNNFPKSADVINFLIVCALLYVFIMTKNVIYVILISLFCVIYLIKYLATLENRPSWINGLFKSYGPRSDVEDMTKKHLYSAALKSLGYAIAFFVLSLIVSFVAPTYFSNNIIVIGVGWGGSILFLAFLISAIHLFIRAMMLKEIK